MAALEVALSLLVEETVAMPYGEKSHLTTDQASALLAIRWKDRPRCPCGKFTVYRWKHRHRSHICKEVSMEEKTEERELRFPMRENLKAELDRLREAGEIVGESTPSAEREADKP